MLKTPVLRNILAISLGAAIAFPALSFTLIFPRFTQQLTLNIQDTAKRVATHLEQAVLVRGSLRTASEFTPELRSKIQDFMDHMDIDRMKIFSEKGQVIFASTPGDEGTWNTHHYFVNQVAKGRIYAKQVKRNEKTLEGRTTGVDVIEIYVPVMSGERFSGAVEIYYDITAPLRAMTTLIAYLKIGVTAFSFLFMTLTVVILGKAGRQMRQRETAETALQAAHDHLEAQVSQRTAELERTNQALTEEILEHRIADQSLRESQKRLTAILEANPNPMVMIDTQGHPCYLNPAFTGLFGWTLDQVRDQPIPFIPDEIREKDQALISGIYRSGQISSFETRRLTRSGACLDVMISAAITRDEADRPDGMVQNITDITKKKQKEAQVRQTQKLESIGTLAGGIAHDFNNILSGIFGYAQLAKINMTNPEKVAKDIDHILKAAQRASELVQQILAFSRNTESRQQTFRPSPLVKESLKLLRASIPATIQIQEQIRSRSQIRADHTQIQQVVMNLCTNAAYAMAAQGGTLTVSLTDVTLPGPDQIQELTPGSYICLEVSDTGTGIPKGIIDKIFDPYFTTKPLGQGTGLGLAVVHGIVQEQKGCIKVRSAPGQGSAFQVFLPLAPEPVPDSPKPAEQEPEPRGKECIMVVDDEAHIRSSVKEYFSDRGYQVMVFSDGAEAIEALDRSPRKVDCLITDITMPNMTGDKLAQKALALRPDLPIIVCSGYSEAVSMEKIKTLGIRKFLQKPFKLKDLLKTVQEHLASPSDG